MTQGTGWVGRRKEKTSANKNTPSSEQNSAAKAVRTFASLRRAKVSRVSRFYLAFGPWGLESEVTFAHDIPYEQVHEFY